MAETEKELLDEYLAEDPSVLSKLQLKKAADLFGLSYEEVNNIAKGMTNARKEVKAQFDETEGEPEAVVTASGWRARWAFHLAGQHDQSSHGSWSDAELNPANTKSDVTPEEAKDIRKWAAVVGKQVGVRGRIPQSIIDEFREQRKLATDRTPVEEIKNSVTGRVPAGARGVNAGKAEKRLAAAVKAYPALSRYGDSLIVQDHGWENDPVLRRHLEDLDSLPDHLVSEFVNAGGSVYVGTGAITDIHPDLAYLAESRPRGWPAGTGYKDVAGVYYPNGQAVVLGVIKSRGSGTPVSNFAYHEMGHAMDALRKKVSLLSQEDRFGKLHASFKRTARAAGYLNNYYVQSGGSPGAGASEFFADGMRAWAKANSGRSRVNAQGFPAGTRAQIVKDAFAETGTLVTTEGAEDILRYFDEKIGWGGKPSDGGSASNLEPRERVAPARVSTRKPRSDAGKVRSTRNVSFQQEQRARSMRRSGATLEEISDALQISVGTLSKLIGGM